MHTAAGAGRYVVAVRTLCDFTAREGDLDRRFNPGPTAQEGMAGHALVASRRPAHYQTEISLEGSHDQLDVRGRADGFDPRLQQIEEIKTHRGDLDAMPANHRHLHWAQARVYGWLLCSKLALTELNVALVYLDIATGVETLLVQRHSAAELRAGFLDQCGRFLDWARHELAHRLRRDAALTCLRFPHGEFRSGQRLLAESVYKAGRRDRCLMAQAPTGIGKTIATLFPMLKAAPVSGLDKIFFLSAKSSGRRLALNALASIGAQARSGRDAGAGVDSRRLPLRVLELVAREKACEHPDKACHGASCPLARNFHDVLPDARRAALAMSGAGPVCGLDLLDRPAVRALALAHGICPYYLGLELARWSDVIVGDYNYFFDLNALLHGLTIANQWRVGVLVDEAHNLVDRARGMYSAELDERRLRALRRLVPAALKTPLARLGRAWLGLNCEQVDDYRACDRLPSRLLACLREATSAISDHLGADPAPDTGELLRFYFDALHFLRVADLFDDRFVFDISRHPPLGKLRPLSTLCLRNVVPARFVGQRLAASASSVLFSATFGPRHFYTDMLGIPADAGWVDVASPFDARQLEVRVIGRLSTRYRDRHASMTPIADLIAGQFRERPGHYLAFFSSFDYLAGVAGRLAAGHPDVPLREQTRGMKEAEQAAFLARFDAAEPAVAFAVLGGSFAEGIDLPGDRLLGAFIVTLGLPQVNPVNEQLRRRLQASFGAGYDYAYLYPGLRKVVQAGGRVIRSPRDRGVLYLIDDRFARREVRRLLPRAWLPD